MPYSQSALLYDFHFAILGFFTSFDSQIYNLCACFSLMHILYSFSSSKCLLLLFFLVCFSSCMSFTLHVFRLDLCLIFSPFILRSHILNITFLRSLSHVYSIVGSKSEKKNKKPRGRQRQWINKIGFIFMEFRFFFFNAVTSCTSIWSVIIFTEFSLTRFFFSNSIIYLSYRLKM